MNATWWFVADYVIILICVVGFGKALLRIRDWWVDAR